MNREEIYKKCCHLQNEIMLFELDKKSQMEVVVFNSIFLVQGVKKFVHIKQREGGKRYIEKSLRQRRKSWHIGVQKIYRSKQRKGGEWKCD
jgi:hypothetical protein